MPIEAAELRRVMGLFATGVTVITTCDARQRPYGLTANAVASLSLAPPLLLVCVDRGAESFPHFVESGLFAVNVLGEDQEAISRRFAVSGGDKFSETDWRPGRSGAPVLGGTLAHVECRIVETHAGGDHVIHIGEVAHADAPGGRPLLFFAGRYQRLPDG